jgi:hypothetical protein
MSILFSPIKMLIGHQDAQTQTQENAGILRLPMKVTKNLLHSKIEHLGIFEGEKVLKVVVSRAREHLPAPHALNPNFAHFLTEAVEKT